MEVVHTLHRLPVFLTRLQVVGDVDALHHDDPVILFFDLAPNLSD
ncbi:MAG: hypothetical protein O2992_06150 [Gemmatimonadetes bacterium]|nr:hypothetical protein [Gemmatimonadota bacterium]